MSTARYMVGDVYDRLAQLDPGSVEVAISSPPFLALRSYLPDSHPDKAREIGSEGTPAAFIDVLLEWTAAVGRVLAPHGSLCVELGDTYAGSGGHGGDYDEGGWRDGQPLFGGAGRAQRAAGGAGWPRAKCLAGIPQAYQLSLAYGRNVLTGAPSPAGRWIIRNVKPWIRSNPPVGALGDKERPATSYVIVATRAPDRYFDLDAVRSPGSTPTPRTIAHGGAKGDPNGRRDSLGAYAGNEHPAGAPPRDWWHHVDAILDAELDRLAGRAGTPVGGNRSPKRRDQTDGNWGDIGPYEGTSPGARGVHLRRALERAGILTTLDALDVSPKGYAGAHYAVWPPELVRLLLAEMCPQRVCTTCGHPSRRITGEATYVPSSNPGTAATRPAGGAQDWASGVAGGRGAHSHKRDGGMVRSAPTLGWSDCGHGTWRAGVVCDPFAGSGTTLAVASGMGFDSIGIDIDYRNASLALERVGMFLDVWWPDHNRLPAIPAGRPSRRYEEWAHLMDHTARHVLELLVDLLHGAGHDDPIPAPIPARAPRGRTVPVVAGQTDLFATQETPT